MPAALRRAGAFLAPLNAAMAEYQINTAARQAAFLAQLAHESGQLAYMRELWGPTPAQLGYEGRSDLGNTESGDGERFKGRGPIQVTGRANYARVSHALFGDDRLLQFPELLEDPAIGCRAAGQFWHVHGLNDLADIGNFKRITKLINGGYNGYDDRLKFYQRALSVLGSVHAHGSSANA